MIEKFLPTHPLTEPFISIIEGCLFYFKRMSGHIISIIERYSVRSPVESQIVFSISSDLFHERKGGHYVRLCTRL